MLEKFKNIALFEEKTFVIIGIVFGEAVTYQILMAERTKEQLSISKSADANTFDDLKKIVGTNLPVLLHFSGKGLVSKKVAPTGNYLKEILFNGATDQFYTYTLFEKANNFVSIGRKEVLDEQFAMFAAHKYKVVDYSIGPFVGTLAKGIIEQNTITLSDYGLDFDEDGLVDFTNEGDTDMKYRLGEESLKSSEVTLLATLLNFLYPSEKIDYENDFLTGNLKERRFKKIFDYTAIGSMILFLIVLLSSFLLLKYYNSEYVTYNEQLYLFNDNYHQVKKMEEDLISKQYIVNQSGLSKKNFLAYYVNEIGSTVPRQIVLSDLHINPVFAKIKAKEKISIEPNSIRIEGQSSGSIYVSEWIKVLKEKKWVGKIEILNLSAAKNGKDSFSLKIQLM